MPSLDGVAIFGLAVSMATADNPRSQQVNTYFGLSGLETLDGGLRGRVTAARGRLVGTTPAALASAEGTFRSYNDGAAHTLVDTFGVTWINVKLDSFEPQGRVQISNAAGGGVIYHRNYTARFLHL